MNTDTPQDRIRQWLDFNPQTAAAIAQGALEAMFVQLDGDSGEDELDPDKNYDCQSVEARVYEAVAASSFRSDLHPSA